MVGAVLASAPAAPAAVAAEPLAVWTRLRARAAGGAAEGAALGAVGEELWVDLAPLSHRRRQEVARADPRFHSPALVLRLLERAYETVEAHPVAGGDLADLALWLAPLVPEAELTPELRGTIAARGWLLAAHALALRGLWPSAERAFRAGGATIASPAGEEAALFARLLGTMRRRQGRRPEAYALLERAARLAEAVGDVVEHGLSLTQLAALHGEDGDLDAVVRLVARTLALKEPWSPPRDLVRERLALAALHAAAGRPQLAEEVLAAAVREAGAAGVELPALFALARSWVALERGDLAAVERELVEAWRAALAAAAPAEAVSAAFQRAALYAAAGRAADLAALARDLEALLPAGLLPGPLRPALRRFQELLRGGHPDAGALARLQGRFRRALLDPARPVEALTMLLDEPVLRLLGAPGRGGAPSGGDRARIDP